MDFDFSENSAFNRAERRAYKYIKQGAQSFVYAFGFYDILKLFGIKIGKGDFPPDRAKQILSSKVYRKDFFIYMIPVYNYDLVFRVEQLATYFATRKETFDPTTPEGYKIQEKLIPMRSGSTERYGITPRQALGITVMARNIIDGKQKSFKTMTEMYDYYNSK